MTRIKSLFKILQVEDSDVCFSHCKLNIDTASEEIINPISDTLVIENPDDIPELITGMSKFFFGVCPNSKGGNIWINIHLLHTQPIENIIKDTKEYFQEDDTSIGLQSIQYWDVGSIGFLQHMHPDVETENLHAYLSAALKK